MPPVHPADDADVDFFSPAGLAGGRPPTPVARPGDLRVGRSANPGGDRWIGRTPGVHPADGCPRVVVGQNPEHEFARHMDRVSHGRPLGWGTSGLLRWTRSWTSTTVAPARSSRWGRVSGRRG